MFPAARREIRLADLDTADVRIDQQEIDQGDPFGDLWSRVGSKANAHAERRTEVLVLVSKPFKTAEMWAAYLNDFVIPTEFMTAGSDYGRYTEGDIKVDNIRRSLNVFDILWVSYQLAIAQNSSNGPLKGRVKFRQSGHSRAAGHIVISLPWD